MASYTINEPFGAKGLAINTFTSIIACIFPPLALSVLHTSVDTGRASVECVGHTCPSCVCDICRIFKYNYV